MSSMFRVCVSIVSFLFLMISCTAVSTAQSLQSDDMWGLNESVEEKQSKVGIQISPLNVEGEDKISYTPSGEQFEWMIEDAYSSHERSFKVLAPGQVELSVDDDSGAIVIEVDGNPEALIDPPWARDSMGNLVNTHFEVMDDSFVQVVDVDEREISYPIIADPRVNWGIVSGHVYFSKEETKKVAAGAASAFAVTPFWALVPPPFGEALGVWWVAHSIEVTSWATAAVAQDKCLALKVGATGSVAPPSVGVSPEHYTDGCE